MPPFDDNNPTFPALYPDGRHPYYIVAPPYTRTSAGVRVLHMLCHALNRRGQTAFISLYPAMPWQHRQVAPDLLTPLLTPAVIRSHFERGLTPVLVYPEVISGNPFDGPCVVRYVLNVPGLLGGSENYAPEELCFSYSKVLADMTPVPENVLFLPATDTQVFCTLPDQPKRQGSCFYAYKYKSAHQGALFDITKNSIEITRDLPDSQTPQELADLFRRSEVFYTYENTALATEAVLCGCPAVFLPNPYLSEIIAVKELGPEGYAWGADPAEVERARATVGQGAQNYLKSYAAFWRDLDRFIDLTQKHAEGQKYLRPVRRPGFVETIMNMIAEYGVVNSVRAAIRRLRKATLRQD